MRGAARNSQTARVGLGKKARVPFNLLRISSRKTQDTQEKKWVDLLGDGTAETGSGHEGTSGGSMSRTGLTDV